MKLVHQRLKLIKLSNKYDKEDLRLLQMQISGKSVYKGISQLYKRIPKHRKPTYSI